LSRDRKSSVISLFNQNAEHSFVPAKFHTAVAQSGGQGQPSRRRIGAPLLTAPSPTAGLRALGTMLCIGAIFALPILCGGVAHAEPALSATHRVRNLSIDPFAAFVSEASKRFAVPEHWIRAVMRVESAGKPRAQSQKGAIGLMQIMPRTWTNLRARYGLGADPYDPRNNILAGAAYIRELHDRYGAPGFLAAYNAGPRRYQNHLATGRPLPDVTQAYVAALAPLIENKQTGGQLVTVVRSASWIRSSLFVARIASNSSDDLASSSARRERPRRVRAVVDLSALVPRSGNLFAQRGSQVRSQ
jgi:transglycosylase-like protein with SLT domain